MDNERKPTMRNINSLYRSTLHWFQCAMCEEKKRVDAAASTLTTGALADRYLKENKGEGVGVCHHHLAQYIGLLEGAVSNFRAKTMIRYFSKIGAGASPYARKKAQLCCNLVFQASTQLESEALCVRGGAGSRYTTSQGTWIQSQHRRIGSGCREIPLT